MTGMELLTAKRLGLHPIVIITHNDAFGTLRAMGHEQAAFVSIPRMDYAKLAEVLGGRGFVIETGAAFHQALHSACDSRTFSILDVHLSPDDFSPALHRLRGMFAKKLQG
jgi:indolepyruvate decarboxylase